MAGGSSPGYTRLAQLHHSKHGHADAASEPARLVRNTAAGTAELSGYAETPHWSICYALVNGARTILATGLLGGTLDDRFLRGNGDCRPQNTKTAFETVPPLEKAPITEPLSANEREWAKQNKTTVRELYSGKLRGMPKHPSRAWVIAFQSAVGGTAAEMAAILGNHR